MGEQLQLSLVQIVMLYGIIGRREGSWKGGAGRRREAIGRALVEQREPVRGARRVGSDFELVDIAHHRVYKVQSSDCRHDNVNCTVLTPISTVKN